MKRSFLGHLAAGSMVLACLITTGQFHVQAQELTTDQINEMKRLKFTKKQIQEAQADRAMMEAAVKDWEARVMADRAQMEAAFKDWEAKQQPRPLSASQPPAAARPAAPDDMTQEEYDIIKKAESDALAGRNNAPCKRRVQDVKTIYAGRNEDYRGLLNHMTVPQTDPTKDNPDPGHNIIIGIGDLIPVDKSNSVRNVAVITAPMITLRMAASPEKCKHMERVIEGLQGHGSVACSVPNDSECVLSYWRNLEGYPTTPSLTDIRGNRF